MGFGAVWAGVVWGRGWWAWGGSACMHPVHNAPFDFGMVLVVAAALLSVGGYYLFGGSKEKPKIN
jgi:hypothetical protein